MIHPSPKCILITGASSGIGYATAELYLSKNWIVYGLSRSGHVPKGAKSLVANINKPEELEKALKNVWTACQRLDAVVHCAGIGGAGPLEFFPIEEAQKIMTTNYIGSLNVAQSCLPYLRKQKESSLIFISSIAGLIGVPFHGVYSASKFATEAMVECLRLELTGSGVKVVSVCPGDTATSIISHQYRSKAANVPVFYQANYTKADNAMRHNVDKGIAPSRVAKTIYAVSLKKYPNVFYLVGDRLQKIAPKIKRVLPPRLFEYIFKSYYGLK